MQLHKTNVAGPSTRGEQRCSCRRVVTLIGKKQLHCLQRGVTSRQLSSASQGRRVAVGIAPLISALPHQTSLPPGAAPRPAISRLHAPRLPARSADHGARRRIAVPQTASIVTAEAPPATTVNGGTPQPAAAPQATGSKFVWSKAWYPAVAEEHLDPTKPHQVGCVAWPLPCAGRNAALFG
jgi:hypothetical protein